ncbi:sensor histidine kinase [Luedemannella helvata]
MRPPVRPLSHRSGNHRDTRRRLPERLRPPAIAVPPRIRELADTSGWSIRTKIIGALATPLVALTVLWLLATFAFTGPALDANRREAFTANVGTPAAALVDDLQAERRLSVAYLAGGGENAGPLSAQRERTDEKIAALRAGAARARSEDVTAAGAATALQTLLTSLDSLRPGRESIDRRGIDRTEAIRIYGEVVDASLRVATPVTAPGDAEHARTAQAVAALDRAHEVLSQEDALLHGIDTNGTLNAATRDSLIGLIGARRYLAASAEAGLDPAARARLQALVDAPAARQVQAIEDNVLAEPARDRPATVALTSWRPAYDETSANLRAFARELAAAPVAADESAATTSVVRAVLIGLLGLLAIIASIVISIRFGRSLIGRLNALRVSALDLAEDRLPSVIGRLRAGEEVDVDAETPALRYGDDEIGHVGDAFAEVQRTAIDSAVQEARLRAGLNEVFVNIARRSQTLLHRQLDLLDQMERRATDPDEMEALFRVDHLATRMRRHAEDLVILAGATPGRGWRSPVPLVDVLRGAVSEVEDYDRVTITPVPQAALHGRYVGDVMHLFAELIENATAFSPPRTQVRLSAQLVPKGLAVDIEDRGLGMTAEDIDAANRRLAEPPDFDPASSERLGLFVVARLADRHGIRVQLRPSPYGGVTAVVLLPPTLLATAKGELTSPPDDKPEPPQRPTDQREPAAPQRREPLARRVPTVPGARPEAARTVVVEPEDAVVVAEADELDVAIAADVELADIQLATDRAATADTEPAGPTGGATDRADATSDGGPVAATPLLPKRVRQANLAAQLRDAPPPDEHTEQEGTAAGDAARHTPQQIRDRMSALQAGMQRGRIAAEDLEPPTIDIDADETDNDTQANAGQTAQTTADGPAVTDTTGTEPERGN